MKLQLLLIAVIALALPSCIGFKSAVKQQIGGYGEFTKAEYTDIVTTGVKASVSRAQQIVLQKDLEKAEAEAKKLASESKKTEAE